MQRESDLAAAIWCVHAPAKATRSLAPRPVEQGAGTELLDLPIEADYPDSAWNPNADDEDANVVTATVAPRARVLR